MCILIHKFVNQDGVIFCEYCGKTKCAHTFEVIQTNPVEDDGCKIGTKYTSRCAKCGEMSYFKNY